jgi:ABC-2 type transport system ATP-binding protein
VRVAVDGVANDELHALLNRVPGVQSVEKTNDGSVDDALFVFPKNGAKVLPAVTAVLREKGLQASSLSVERGRLDDVFRQMTTVPASTAARSST